MTLTLTSLSSIPDELSAIHSTNVVPTSAIPPSRNRQHLPPAPFSPTRTTFQPTCSTVSQSNHANAHHVPIERVSSSPFAFTPFELASVLDPKNIQAARALGGVDGLLDGLGTDKTHGLTQDLTIVGLDQPTITSHQGTRDDVNNSVLERRLAYSASLDERRRVYGRNVLPERGRKSFLSLIWAALKDKVLVLLFIATLISLVLGVIQDFTPGRTVTQSRVDWVEGLVIVVAISIVVIVGSLNDWQKEQQFRTLNEQKEERSVKVIRDSVVQLIDPKDVVVGDLALFEQGEIIPCDGVFLTGNNVKCDESGATGEPNLIKKISYDQCLQHIPRGETDNGMEIAHADCFLVSGSKVIEGTGRYVVVAVGPNSFNGRIMMALRGDGAASLLQLNLNKISETIAKLGILAALIFFVSFMIQFAVQLAKNDPPKTAIQKGADFISILVMAVILGFVTVNEGFPMAVTLVSATFPKLLRLLIGPYEILAHTSIVCADMTDMLAQNSTSVVVGSIGIHAKFVANNDVASNMDDESGATTMAEDEDGIVTVVRARPLQNEDFSINLAQLDNVLSPQLHTLFKDAVYISSRISRDSDPQLHESVLSDDGTADAALLDLFKSFKLSDSGQMNQSVEIAQVLPSSKELKVSGVAARLPNGRIRIYFKGVSEILVKKCARHVVVRKEEYHASGNGGEIETAEVDALSATNIEQTIKSYSNQGLRTIAICYRDLESCSSLGLQHSSDDRVDFEDAFRDLVLISIMGIRTPLKPGSCKAVSTFWKAGIAVKMCTEDPPLTARAIARQCGIYTPNGIVMEGSVFRGLNNAQMYSVLPQLQVLARCSAQDRKILVEKLSDLGEVVVDRRSLLMSNHPGSSTRDAWTRRPPGAAFLGGDLDSVVKSVAWARRLHNFVRKVLQFRLPAIISAVVITFICSVAATPPSFIFSAVQLLWIHIIMDTFVDFAMTVDLASENVLHSRPERRDASLFSINMYKQVISQSIWQVVASLMLRFGGSRIFGFSHGSLNSIEGQRVIGTLVFNAFVFSQIFNFINSRRLDNKLNILEGMLHSPRLIGIIFLLFTLQILIIFFGGPALQVVRLSAREWAISVTLGFLTIPLGAVVRFVPNSFLMKLVDFLGLRRHSSLLPTSRPGYIYTVNSSEDNLKTFSMVRGGRIRASSFVQRSRFQAVRCDPAPLISTSLFPFILSSGHPRSSNSAGSRHDGFGTEGQLPMNVRLACESLTGRPRQPDSWPSNSGRQGWKRPKVLIGVVGLVIGLISAVSGLVPLISHPT